MNVTLKLFPVTGMNEKSRTMSVVLEEGASLEALLCHSERLAGNKIPDKGIMVILNGKTVDRAKAGDIRLADSDVLWIMPMLSGG